jgi:multidrug resistance efflux pump
LSANAKQKIPISISKKQQEIRWFKLHFEIVMAKNNPSSEVFYWDAPRRRLHKRDLFPLQMEINETTYFISQWTLKHFKVVNYTDEIKLGKEFTITPIVKFRDFNIQFDATAIALHYNIKNQELIATFKDISEEHQELLQYFSEALNTGDMVNIDNVLRRVDMPVTPASTKLAEIPTKKNKAHKLKRGLFASLYLLVGAGLFLFTIATLYNSFFRLEVETAFVNSAVILVQTRSQGNIKDILVKNDELVSAGQPLLILDISDNERLPKQYRIDRAKQQVALFQALLNDSNDKTASQTHLSQTKVNAANATLQATIITRKLKCNRRYANDIDRRNPRKRKAECHVARKKVTAARAHLKASIAYLTAAKKSYKNNTQASSEGNKKSTAVLHAKLAQAQQKVNIIERTPESLSGTETIYSPTAGKIIKIVDVKNQYIKKGHLIAVIQQPDSEQFIEAHITQEEATKLQVGNKAIAYSPSLARDYPLVIDQVDLTNAVISVNNIRLFNQYIPEDKTAKIILKFIDKQSETLSFALPVTLSIEKQTRFSTKLKNSIASLFNMIIGKAHADDLLPVFRSPYCSIYTSEPAYCKNATHLFPQGFIDNIKQLNQPADAVKKNSLF